MLLMTISDRINQELDFLENVKQTTIDNILQTTETVKNNLSEASDRAITTTITQTAQITDNVNNITTKALENAIDFTIKNWLNQHPVLFWLVTHPIWTLIIFLFVIFLIFGLFEAVTTLIKSLWLFIFKMPEKLVRKTANLTIITFQNIGNQIFWPQNSHQNKLKLTKIGNKSDRQQRIAEILDRLEQLKQEQNRLLTEIAEMLETEENKAKHRSENTSANWMTSRQAKSHN